MDYKKIKYLKDAELYDQLFSELSSKQIKAVELNKIIEDIFNDWNFEIIENLQAKQIISKEFVNFLILKNKNLTGCFYMLKYLSNIEAIINNIDNLIRFKLKNIHAYNLLLGILRNMIINPHIQVEKRDKILDLYLKYADYDNLQLCMLGLENADQKLLLKVSKQINDMENTWEFFKKFANNDYALVRSCTSQIN